MHMRNCYGTNQEKRQSMSEKQQDDSVRNILKGLNSKIFPYFKIFLFALIALVGVLLFADGLILVNEGRGGYVEGYGDVGDDLVCEYFTGHSFLTTVYDYSPNNSMGRDSCPFWKAK